jgi:RNA polymerase sigma factor (sigma-70 family)
VGHFSTLIKAHYPAIYNFVRREIAYHVAMRNLGPDDVIPDDVVAAVAVRAHRKFRNKPQGRDVRGWLIQLAIQELEAEVTRVSKAGVAARVEEDIPETLPTQAVCTLGDEVLEFHQPDEDLKLEDAIPSSVPTPEEILERHELQEYIDRTLAALRPAWRRAFVLRYVEDLPVAEVARIVGGTTEDVERQLEAARDRLRQRLMKAGFALQDLEIERMFGTVEEMEVPYGIRRAVDETPRLRDAGAKRAPT